MATRKSTPSDSVIYAQYRSPTMLNELGVCAMQVRTYETRGEQNLLIISTLSSWKSWALMFIARANAAQSGLELGHRGGAGKVIRIKFRRRIAGQIRVLAREAHFHATIADLYKPDAMPDNLRTAHGRNDDVLERIYIGRRFRNDAERLEKLFELYTKMTTKVNNNAGFANG